jgi:phage anti-repressor protein
VLIELLKLIKVSNLHKILEKSATSLKWKLIDEVFEKRKNDFIFVEEKAEYLLQEFLR